MRIWLALYLGLTKRHRAASIQPPQHLAHSAPRSAMSLAFVSAPSPVALRATHVAHGSRERSSLKGSRSTLGAAAVAATLASGLRKRPRAKAV